MHLLKLYCLTLLTFSVASVSTVYVFFWISGSLRGASLLIAYDVFLWLEIVASLALEYLLA